jgi:uncharacterized protein YbjT (DUF2867 family)
MSQEIILVTGAAGGVGSTAHTAIATLLEQGRRVRAMVRKPDARADTLRKMGAEVVVADMLDIINVRAAMQGCSVLYFTMSISPSYLEAAANVAVTAKSLGVKAFVNLSQMTVSEMSETETTSSPQQKQHWLAEQMLRWSGLPVVYLRPTAFFDGIFLVEGAKGIRDADVIRLPFADGKTALIAGADVGVAAAAVLANPEPHIGKVYELTGPESLTMAQYAREFSRALGRTIQYVNVPPQIWEAKLHEAQLPAHLIAHLITMGQLHRDNRYDRMTDSFKQLVGRAPISGAEFARRHAAAFRPGGSSGPIVKQTLIAQAYSAFNHRDIDSALALMSENVSWPKASEGGRVVGKEEIRAYWTRQWQEFDPHVEPLDVTDQEGGRTAVKVHQLVKSLAGDVLSDSEVWHVYTFANGLIERMDLKESETSSDSSPSTAFSRR